VYNYGDNIWYYGSMARTAWLDNGMLTYPIATTLIGNIVNHEDGLDDYSGLSPVAIDSYITSSEFDVDDGDVFYFIRRILTDITFRGSNNVSPLATLTILPMVNAGSGYTNPPSTGGTDIADIVGSVTAPIEQFTGEVFIRVRGRSFTMKIECNQVGTMWQLGQIRFDMRPDGKK
jgi:hypothetical protein